MKKIELTRKERRIILNLSPYLFDRIYRNFLLYKIARHAEVQKKDVIKQAYYDNLEMVYQYTIK